MFGESDLGQFKNTLFDECRFMTGKLSREEIIAALLDVTAHVIEYKIGANKEELSSE